MIDQLPQDVQDAVAVLDRPCPDISALTSPWPPSEPTDDPVVRLAQRRFVFQRARYLRYMDDIARALDTIREAHRRAHPWQYRRAEAQAAIRRHRDEVLARDGWVCGLCGGAIVEGDLSIDHITPISLGGSDHPENMQPAHKSCNSRKGNRLDWEVGA